MTILFQTGRQRRGMAEVQRSMKAALMAITATLLASGCHSVRTREVPTAYPLPPVSLAEFFKSPADGIYSLPESAASPYLGVRPKVIIVSGGRIRLSFCDDRGRIGTNDWDFVEFKATLPSEEAFQQIVAGTTEEQMERCFGKPRCDQAPLFLWRGSSPDRTRVVDYVWFTVSPMSELIFTRLTVCYTGTKDGARTVNQLRWEKWADRRLSSNQHLQPTPR